ncbi:MAG: DUF2975 domain-containing protein [Terrisporobacter sp.]|uniref:DUF2975 domain-containing protein n=1 Tax=Terrisporobacter sp. TaxID=1965305 RepID=UPI002FC7DCD5
MKKKLSKSKRILSTFLPIIIFIVGLSMVLGALIGIPYVFMNIGDIDKVMPGILTFIIGLSYLMAFIFLWNIVDSSKASIFIIENVKRFKLIGLFQLINVFIEYISFIGSGGHGMRFINLTPWIFITPGMAVYFITSLICFVIAESFEEAIKIKHDNELTI